MIHFRFWFFSNIYNSHDKYYISKRSIIISSLFFIIVKKINRNDCSLHGREEARRVSRIERLCGCRNENGNLERGSCGKRGVKEVEEGRPLKPEVISVNRHVLPPRSNVSVLYSPVSDKIFIPRWEKFICLQQHLAPPPAMAIPLFLLPFHRGEPRGWKFIRASLAFVTDRSGYYTYVRKSTRGPYSAGNRPRVNERAVCPLSSCSFLYHPLYDRDRFFLNRFCTMFDLDAIGNIRCNNG